MVLVIRSGLPLVWLVFLALDSKNVVRKAIPNIKL